jgi:energy-coupling factor transport system ATP-binding protein
MAVIEARNLRVKYPGRKLAALGSLNLQIEEGETVLLLGASGCGKSTLALTLNGLIPHEIGQILEGSVTVAGRNTQKVSVAELTQKVGIVFQDPESQFATLTVEDELAFGLENLCCPPAEMDARIDRALSLVGMQYARHRRTTQLSGGEKQRIAIASLLVMEPSILVFDEPTANLDPVGTQEVFQLIRELKKQGTYTILIIEHKLDDLLDLLDRVIVLNDTGSVLVEGTPQHVFGEHIELLQQHGVWIPQIVSLFQRLREQGVMLPVLPLQYEDAIEALKTLDLKQAKQGEVSIQEPTAETQTTVLEVRDLHYQQSGHTILDHLSFSIPQGDFLAVVGSNGAGKTSLVQHLVGILAAGSGHVHLRGQDVSKIQASKLLLEVGYVFQNPEHQFITASVADEVRYSLKVLKRPVAECEQVTDDLLERFRLKRLARANPFTLSHGEKRRLSVATMLAVGQQILILDEPTFGQDQQNAEKLLELLVQLHVEGRTIIVVTHDMSLVARYAHHVLVLDQGKQIFYGRPQQLFTQPQILTQARLTMPPLAALAGYLGYPEALTLDVLAEACLPLFTEKSRR